MSRIANIEKNISLLLWKDINFYSTIFIYLVFIIFTKLRPLPNEDELKKRQDEHKKRTADSKKENTEIELVQLL